MKTHFHYMNKPYKHLYELIKLQNHEGLSSGIAEFIQSSQLDLNVGDVHARNLAFIEGENPLTLAVKTWNLDVIKLFLDNGASPNYQYCEASISGLYLPVSAVFFQTHLLENRRKEIIELMSFYGLDFDIVNALQENLLQQSVQRVCIDISNNFTTIDYLLEKNININYSNTNKNALSIAILKEYEKLALYLIDKGAKLNNDDDDYFKVSNSKIYPKVLSYYEAKEEKDMLEASIINTNNTLNKLKI